MNDTISREAAMDALNEYFDRIGKLKRRGLNKGEKAIRLDTVGTINSLPPAEPSIVYCKDCVKHNKGIGDIEEQPYGLRKHIMKDEACPLVSWRGKAQGHEFDYQFCAYGKRREVTT